MVWWQPAGWLRWIFCFAYAASWGFLLKGMTDAGLAVQTGFLGWGAIVRNREPAYGGFAPKGTFRYVRQPIYLAFALTLWTGPVWTPDHLLLAATWTGYCMLGPVLKERRYLRAYGDRFVSYRERVPYWVPVLRRS
jgi:protein-S-isoprenylcysteine O-methyltransferase Ste14